MAFVKMAKKGELQERVRAYEAVVLSSNPTLLIRAAEMRGQAGAGGGIRA